MLDDRPVAARLLTRLQQAPRDEAREPREDAVRPVEPLTELLVPARSHRRELDEIDEHWSVSSLSAVAVDLRLGFVMRTALHGGVELVRPDLEPEHRLDVLPAGVDALLGVLSARQHLVEAGGGGLR